MVRPAPVGPLEAYTVTSKRLPILLMLALIALQGGGLWHAVHVALEHGGQSHLHGVPPETGDSDGWTRAAHRSAHNPVTCPVCQVLASTKSLAGGGLSVLTAEPPAAMRHRSPGAAVCLHDPTGTLGPRAPPLALSPLCV